MKHLFFLFVFFAFITEIFSQTVAGYRSYETYIIDQYGNKSYTGTRLDFSSPIYSSFSSSSYSGSYSGGGGGSATMTFGDMAKGVGMIIASPVLIIKALIPKKRKKKEEELTPGNGYVKAAIDNHFRIREDIEKTVLTFMKRIDSVALSGNIPLAIKLYDTLSVDKMVMEDFPDLFTEPYKEKDLYYNEGYNCYYTTFEDQLRRQYVWTHIMGDKKKVDSLAAVILAGHKDIMRIVKYGDLKEGSDELRWFLNDKKRMEEDLVNKPVSFTQQQFDQAWLDLTKVYMPTFDVNKYQPTFPGIFKKYTNLKKINMFDITAKKSWRVNTSSQVYIVPPLAFDSKGVNKEYDRGTYSLNLYYLYLRYLPQKNLIQHAFIKEGRSWEHRPDTIYYVDYDTLGTITNMSSTLSTRLQQAPSNSNDYNGDNDILTSYHGWKDSATLDLYKDGKYVRTIRLEDDSMYFSSYGRRNRVHVEQGKQYYLLHKNDGYNIFEEDGKILHKIRRATYSVEEGTKRKKTTVEKTVDFSTAVDMEYVPASNKAWIFKDEEEKTYLTREGNVGLYLISLEDNKVLYKRTFPKGKKDLTAVSITDYTGIAPLFCYADNILYVLSDDKLYELDATTGTEIEVHEGLSNIYDPNTAYDHLYVNKQTKTITIYRSQGDEVYVSFKYID